MDRAVEGDQSPAFALVLWDAGTGSMQMKAIEQAAGVLAVQIDVLEVRTRADFEAAFASASRQGAGAVVMLSSAVVSMNIEDGRIVAKGTATLTWIQRARTFSRMLPAGAPPVDLSQVQDINL